MARAGKYGNVEIPGIPDDEPVYILRAQDSCAARLIDTHYDMVKMDYRRKNIKEEIPGLSRSGLTDVQHDFLDALSRRADEMMEWQDREENWGKTKTPD